MQCARMGRRHGVQEPDLRFCCASPPYRALARVVVVVAATAASKLRLRLARSVLVAGELKVEWRRWQGLHPSQISAAHWQQVLRPARGGRAARGAGGWG